MRARQLEETHQGGLGNIQVKEMACSMLNPQCLVHLRIQLNIHRRSICSASGMSAGEVHAWWETQVFFPEGCADLGVTSIVVQLWEEEDYSD